MYIDTIILICSYRKNIVKSLVGILWVLIVRTLFLETVRLIQCLPPWRREALGGEVGLPLAF